MMKEKEMKRVPKLRFPEFTDDWEQRKLGEIVDYNNGIGHEEYVLPEGKYELVTLKSINSEGEMVCSEKFVNEEFETLQQGTLIMMLSEQAKGMLGMTTIIPCNNKYVLNQRVAALTLHDGINGSFLTKAINKMQYYFEQMGAGTKVQNITKGHVEKCLIEIPRYEEQLVIGKFFSDIDNFITLHQRKLKNLNVLKKCVMQKLFSQKVKFKADDGSEFPKWKEKRLGDVFTERTERSKGGETLLSVTIAQGIVRQSETDKRNTASENKSNYKIVKRNDLAYNTMRMWQGAEGVSEYDGIVSPAYTVITALDGNNSYFFEILFKQTFMLQIFQRYSQGLTSDTWNLKFPTFSEIKCLVPCEDEQNKIVECVTVLDSVIEKQKATLAAWKELKKGLLQQMFV